MNKNKSAFSQNRQIPVDDQHPYLGLSSYQEEYNEYFFGRSREVADLQKMLRKSVLTVIFGKSGLGKTSLLKAGLFPKLRPKYYLPIYLRINFNQAKDKSIINQVKEAIEEEIRSIGLRSMAFGNLTFWEYFYSLNILDGHVKPVLVFDQFEEIFTIGKKYQHQVERLIKELSNLIENKIPLEVQRKYPDTDIPYAHKEQTFKVIFSLREDYLPALENLTTLIPSLRKNRMRLHQFDAKSAMAAVYEPGKNIIEPAEANKIIDLIVHNTISEGINEEGKKMKQMEIEPFLLSLICERINQKRFDENGDVISEKISAEIIEDISVKGIIKEFYEDSTKVYGEGVNKFIEKRLLTKDGYRRLQPLSDTLDLDDVSESDIQGLIDKRIIRKEIWNGREQIELIHDVLVPIVKEKRLKRVASEKELEFQKALDESQKKYREELKRQEQKQLQRIKSLRKNLLLGIALVLVSGLIVGSIFQFRHTERNKYLSKANDLSYQSLTQDTRLGGLLAVQAFAFNKNYDGKINENIYNALFTSLQELDYGNLGRNSFERNSEKELREIVLLDSLLISAGKTGVIIQQPFITNRIKIDTFFESIQKIYTLTKDKENQWLAVGGYSKDSNFIELFDLKSFLNLPPPFAKKTYKIPTQSPTRALVFDTTSKYLFSGDDDGVLYAYHLDSLLEKQALRPISMDYLKGNKISALALNDEFIAIGTHGKGVYLIDRMTKDTVNLSIKFFSKEIANNVGALKFSPDNEFLAIGDSKGRLIFYDINEETYDYLQYHYGTINDIDFKFSNEQRLMATASADSRTGIWDLNKKDAPLFLQDVFYSGQRAIAYSLKFEDENEYLYVGYGNGVIRKWPLSFQEMANSICERLRKNILGNCLERKEWNQFIGEDFEFENYCQNCK